MKRSEKLKLQIQKEKEKIREIERKRKEKAEAKKRKRELKAVKLERSKMSPEFYRDFFKTMKHNKLILINMELTNGNHKTFWITEDGDSFKWENNRYIFDPELKYYNIDFKSYCYDFYQGFSLPIRRQFPVNDVKKALSESQMIETEYATNPSTLERFMNSSIIEMMLRGGAIDKLIKIVLIVGMITGILTLANLLLFMYSQGYFNNLGI